jgi:ornithine--oxo-acid transaminase
MNTASKEFKYATNNYKVLGRTMVRGKGIHVFDEYNRRYIDCISGYSALNQGHCHPEILKEAINQMKKLTLTSRAYHNDKLGPYSEMLCKTFDYDKVLLMNGGVESGESAIKISRSWGYNKKKVPMNKAINIFFNNNFWGRSLAACSSSDDPSCYGNFGPYMKGFKLMQFNDIHRLRYFLQTNSNVVSIMFEPIQGEGGIILPENNFLWDLRNLCNQYNVLMIADEVQTGLYRTGTLTACEQFNIKPDLLCLGKALSGGFYPISAVLGNKEIMDVLTPGTHGSTFGGNPLACAIGMKALKVLENEKMGENSTKLGIYFRKRICEIQHYLIKEVRGIGLLNGIEFVNGYIAEEFVDLLLKENVLSKVTRETVVRITPPLMINEDEMTLLIQKIKCALSKL